MISTNHLNALSKRLDDYQTKQPALLDEFVDLLTQIYNLPEYQEWLENGEVLSPVNPGSRFALPRSFGTSLTSSQRQLAGASGLLNGSLLQAKVDLHGDRIHLTDGSWVSPSVRVYPFTDESLQIIKYANEAGYNKEHQILLDPACGCGHHGLALGSITHKVALDVNFRALAYCRINSLLSQSEHMLTGVSDIRDGFPSILSCIDSGSLLVTINMPFAIYPKKQGLPTSLAQDGETKGIALTMAAIQSLLAFKGRTAKTRALVLFYSLGDRKTDTWEVVSQSKALFGDTNVRYRMLTGEQMWRVNGRKVFRAPMSVSDLKEKANCRHTFDEDAAASAERGYEELAAEFLEQGLRDLHYGILDISVS